MAATNVSLKLLVDPEKHRVLFAEAGNDFVDFLFNILCLSCGTVIRLLTKESMVGCLGNIYSSIENLSDKYIQPNRNKDSILKPTISNTCVNVGLLLPNIESSTPNPKLFYKCGNLNNGSHVTSNSLFGSSSCGSRSFVFGTASTTPNSYWGSTIPNTKQLSNNCGSHVADDPIAKCPNCKNLMNRPVTYVAPPRGNNASSSKEGGFVKGVVTYMVMDDLEIRPMSMSTIAKLSNLHVKDVGSLEEKVVDLGTDELMKLLKASFQSKTVLTDVFLGKKEAN